MSRSTRHLASASEQPESPPAVLPKNLNSAGPRATHSRHLGRTIRRPGKRRPFALTMAVIVKATHHGDPDANLIACRCSRSASTTGRVRVHVHVCGRQSLRFFRLSPPWPSHHRVRLDGLHHAGSLEPCERRVSPRSRHVWLQSCYRAGHLAWVSSIAGGLTGLTLR